MSGTIGICHKCGKETVVRNHHWKGYSEEHRDDVVTYCHSCDRIAHNKARREGRCALSSETINRLSILSNARRAYKNVVYPMFFDYRVITNIVLREKIIFNKNTGNVYCSSYFQGGNGLKLKTFEI